ncbi:MAG: hypothetical protein JO308_11395 [Verrucomicrobia bacterium]|nr:hypothetical protein [Verrucomicrobiota bacterium]
MSLKESFKDPENHQITIGIVGAIAAILWIGGFLTFMTLLAHQMHIPPNP